MSLGITEEVFFQLAGHDGSEIIFPQPEPRCRRAFHVSEAIYVAMRLGFSATQFDLCPSITDRDRSKEVLVLYGEFQSEDWNRQIFDSLILTTAGVAECRTSQGNGHAVAYERGRIFDPDGREFPYSVADCEARHLYINRLWRIEKTL